MPVVMGTAGHIDHGKTSLVRALTGVDCDRLAEEKRRGITIELGFAYLDAPDGSRLGIVDVPGHERFVKNMVAGAQGIDFVLLTVAADEGVMPQTREHVEICGLLGVPKGLVALTKSDMVDAELLELATEDVREELAGTFLDGAPIIPVSSRTGQGLEDVRQALFDIAANVAQAKRSDLFRLPVDRVFTLRGHGTVVTGTLLGGGLAVGEEVEVSPRGLMSKARGIQSHGSALEIAEAGSRVALNLQGLEVEDLDRGDVICRPGTLFPSTSMDLELTCLKSSPRPLRHRKEIHLHHGARETMARIYFLDRDKLEPGETALAQARFEAPIPAVRGDRVVLRGFSPLRTVAGGRVLSPLGAVERRKSERLARLQSLRDADAARTALIQLEGRGEAGLDLRELAVLTGADSSELSKIMADLSNRGQVLRFDQEAGRYVHATALANIEEKLKNFVARHHEANPSKPGPSRGELAQAAGLETASKLLQTALARLVRKKDLEQVQEAYRLPGFEPSAVGDAAALRELVLSAYTQAGWTPPSLKEVLARAGARPAQATDVMRLLTQQRELVKVKEELFFSRRAWEEIRAEVEAYFADNQELAPSDFRDLTHLSRKYTIPLLEFLDKERVTVRVGDKRILRKR
ncbi:MAG: selenocysteine-specific elongation factor [Desulfovibrionales bacterium]|nr:selenocysteine-specific elongation factor [Desulfovibrionales bacterium]